MVLVDVQRIPTARIGTDNPNHVTIAHGNRNLETHHRPVQLVYKPFTGKGVRFLYGAVRTINGHAHLCNCRVLIKHSEVEVNLKVNVLELVFFIRNGHIDALTVGNLFMA